MRNWFVRSMVIGIVAMAPGLSGVEAQTTAPQLPQIVTSGNGEAQVTPDRATIYIGVQTRAASATVAGAENARRQRAVLDTLKALGLPSNQISTMNYNVSPEMQYSPNGQQAPRVTGYVVTNTIRADLRRIDEVGRVVDAVLAKGANEISSLQFYSSQADSARRAALTVAVANARSDAEALARAAGGSLGRLIELSTSGYVRPVMDVGMVRSMAAAPKAPTPIEAGQQTVSAVVSARWEFVSPR